MGKLDSCRTASSAKGYHCWRCAHRAKHGGRCNLDHNTVVKTILLFLIGVAMSQNVAAQDSTRAKRFEYVAGATLAFSLLDYVGFNIAIRQLHNSEPVYHSIQT